MYTEKDLQSIIAQRTKRWISLSVPMAALVAVIVFSLISRIQLLTITATIFLGFVLIGGHGLLIKPLSQYAVHLRNALHGKVHTAALKFDHIDEDTSTVDGVEYHQLVCTQPGDDGTDEERLFYWDCQKEFPAVEKGTLVNVTFHDREICDFSIA